MRRRSLTEGPRDQRAILSTISDEEESMTQILPPFIVHDGSREALRMVKVMTRLCHPTTEVIDASSEAGRERVASINRGLKAGILDMRIPPLALGLDEESLRDLLGEKSK